jgi:hypothetical protein
VSDEPEMDAPYELRGGIWANHVDVFGDVQEATLDFVGLTHATRSGVVVARVTVSMSCILTLKSNLERFT